MRRLLIPVLTLLLLAAAGAAVRFWPSPESPSPPVETAFPVPPFPPRFNGGPDEDKCLALLDDDPDAAATLASRLKTDGGRHCLALAAIAGGEPETGAKTLEALAKNPKTPALLRAVLLGQAADAWLDADEAEKALADANEALAIDPDHPGTLFSRASAHDSLDQTAQAMDDLNRSLTLDPERGDALLLRASLYRRADRLSEARADIDKAVALDPEDADTLVERGTIRQLMGDRDGARADWMKAQEIDPNSEAAEQAAQNLTLLDTGPEKK